MLATRYQPYRWWVLTGFNYSTAVAHCFLTSGSQVACTSNVQLAQVLIPKGNRSVSSHGHPVWYHRKKRTADLKNGCFYHLLQAFSFRYRISLPPFLEHLINVKLLMCILVSVQKDCGDRVSLHREVTHYQPDLSRENWCSEVVFSAKCLCFLFKWHSWCFRS